MTARNYFFIANCAPTKEEEAEIKRLGDFVPVNSRYGDTFRKPVNKVAGLVPEHLKEFAIKDEKPVADETKPWEE